MSIAASNARATYASDSWRLALIKSFICLGKGRSETLGRSFHASLCAGVGDVIGHDGKVVRCVDSTSSAGLAMVDPITATISGQLLAAFALAALALDAVRPT